MPTSKSTTARPPNRRGHLYSPSPFIILVFTDPLIVCKLRYIVSEMSFLFAPASASAASSTPPAVSSPSLLPPSLEQLHALTATKPSGRFAGKKGRSAKNGKIIAKFFNTVGARPSPPVGSLEQSIRVTLEYTAFMFSTSTTVPTFASSVYTLNNFSSVSAYTNLFDQYRFDTIEVWMEPRAAQGATVFDTLYSVVDLDDGNTPAAVSDVSSKQGALIGEGGAGRYHKWQPHMAVATYSGAFTSYANEPASWIDCASPNVQHFGFKVAASPTPVGILYSQCVRAVVTFRAPGI